MWKLQTHHTTVGTRKCLQQRLLNEMKDSEDAQPLDQQTGFRKDWSCTDWNATPQIIVERSSEWNLSLCIGLLKYEKAFDSSDGRIWWNPIWHCRVSEIVNIVWNSYGGLHWKAVKGGQLTYAFHVKTSVRKECSPSPFRFLLVVNWIMIGNSCIQWISRMKLEDLDFAYDSAIRKKRSGLGCLRIRISDLYSTRDIRRKLVSKFWWSCNSDPYTWIWLLWLSVWSGLISGCSIEDLKFSWFIVSCN